MNLLQIMTKIVVLGAVLTCLNLRAHPQADSTSPIVSDRDPAPVPTVETPRLGRVLLDVKEEVPLASTPRPTLPERQELHPDVARKLREFHRQRELYLRQRQAFEDRFRNATDQERARLRERYRALQDQWQKYSQELRDQAAQRRTELKDKLPDHRRVLEEAREDLRDTATKIRENPRRGTD